MSSQWSIVKFLLEPQRKSGAALQVIKEGTQSVTDAACSTALWSLRQKGIVDNGSGRWYIADREAAEKFIGTHRPPPLSAHLLPATPPKPAAPKVQPTGQEPKLPEQRAQTSPEQEEVPVSEQPKIAHAAPPEPDGPKEVWLPAPRFAIAEGGRLMVSDAWIEREHVQRLFAFLSSTRDVWDAPGWSGVAVKPVHLVAGDHIAAAAGT